MVLYSSSTFFLTVFLVPFFAEIWSTLRFYFFFLRSILYLFIDLAIRFDVCYSLSCGGNLYSSIAQLIRTLTGYRSGAIDHMTIVWMWPIYGRGLESAALFSRLSRGPFDRKHFGQK